MNVAAEPEFISNRDGPRCRVGAVPRYFLAYLEALSNKYFTEAVNDCVLKPRFTGEGVTDL